MVFFFKDSKWNQQLKSTTEIISRYRGKIIATKHIAPENITQVNICRKYRQVNMVMMTLGCVSRISTNSHSVGAFIIGNSSCEPVWCNDVDGRHHHSIVWSSLKMNNRSHTYIPIICSGSVTIDTPSTARPSIICAIANMVANFLFIFSVLRRWRHRKTHRRLIYMTTEARMLVICNMCYGHMCGKYFLFLFDRVHLNLIRTQHRKWKRQCLHIEMDERCGGCLICNCGRRNPTHISSADIKLYAGNASMSDKNANSETDNAKYNEKFHICADLIANN